MTHVQRAFAVFLLGGVLTFNAAAQEAGRVILSIGDVSIRRGADTRPAAIGSTLQNGDTLRVGAASNAQVRFIDEAVVALRPGTEFTVDDYNWPGAANGLERAFFSLLKGGMRTVTGVIGKASQQNYRVTTPTSTIGIRGTNFNLVQCDAECANRDGTTARSGTYGGIFDGKIGVFNQAGERIFGVEEFFYVASLTALAEPLIGPPPFLGDRLVGSSRRKGEKGTETSEEMAQSGVNADSRPLSSPAPTPPQTFVATEVFNTSGDRTALNTPFTHVVVVSHAEFTSSNVASGVAGVNAANMVFSGSGATQTLVSVTAFPNAAVDQEGGFGYVGPSGTDMVGYGAAVNAHWGRWIDGVVDDSTQPSGLLTPVGGVHYLYSDQITPAEVIAAKSGAFNYNVLIGGTNPTDNSGNIGFFSGGSVNVNFTNRTAALNANWSVASSAYSVSGLSGPIQIFPGIAASIEINGNNVGSCVGPCGGAPGAIQEVKSNGVFLGPTGNHLPMSIASRNGTQTTSQVQLFYCPSCP